MANEVALQIRVTKDVKVVLELAAAQAGMTFSSWARSALLNFAGRQTPPPTKLLVKDEKPAKAETGISLKVARSLDADAIPLPVVPGKTLEERVKNARKMDGMPEPVSQFQRKPNPAGWDKMSNSEKSAWMRENQ